MLISIVIAGINYAGLSNWLNFITVGPTAAELCMQPAAAVVVDARASERGLKMMWLGGPDAEAAPADIRVHNLVGRRRDRGVPPERTQNALAVQSKWAC